MADPASLALGVAGLAGLFATCLQLFDIIEAGSNHERDLGTILCLLKVEKVRFILWGESAGLWAPNATGVAGRVPPRLQREAVQSAVMSVFASMRTTFLRTSTLIDRYPLLDSASSTFNATASQIATTNNTRSPAWFKRHDDQQESSGIGRKIRWALRDKKLADELISTIRSFNDSLAALVPEAGTQHQIGEISETEARVTNILRTTGSRCLLPLEVSTTRQIGLPEQMSEGEQSSTRARSHTSATASAKKDPKGSSICHDMPWIPDSSTILRDSSGVREEIGSEPESPKSSSKPVPANKPSLSLRGRQNANPDPRTRPDVTEPYYPPACVKAIARQLQAVEQDPLGSINIVPISNNLTKCRATIKGPDNTPYANGTFYLSVNFPSAYPFEPPEIKFLTRVYHFNFDHHTGDICLKDHLKGYWSPSIHILDILLCLRALLLSPNERDPYLPEVGKLFYADPEAYEAIAKLYTEQYAYKLSDNDDLVKN